MTTTEQDELHKRVHDMFILMDHDNVLARPSGQEIMDLLEDVDNFLEDL